jgi:hypothetical protein
MVESYIDQLWYTWSDIGLGGITPFGLAPTQRGGWQVRAASQKLLDDHGKRFVNLDRYLRYQLPSGTDQYALELEDAPICLCLATVERERILVSKQYSGEDGYSREGVHFAHLLAGLPDFYSASDAILTWRSSFWQKAEPNDARTTLDAISLQSLAAEATFLWSQMSERVKSYLPFIIQSYLAIENNSREKNNIPTTSDKRKAPGRFSFLKNFAQSSSDNTPQADVRHIYIAAAPDEVAEVIYWLTKSLPKSLLNALTFSTYEKDVLAKDLPLLVGTCWVPGPEPGQDLPSECYHEGLAVNFYTEKRSSYESPPDAVDYAEFATERLANYRADDDERKEFEDFLKESAQDTSVGQLIARYRKFENEIKYRYDPTKLSEILQEMRVDLELVIRKLGDSRYRQLMLWEFQEPSRVWETEGIHSLFTLRKECEKDSEVDRGLLQLAEDLIPYALAALRAANISAFTRCLDIMECVTPPTPGGKCWLELFAALKKERSATSAFISKHWDLQARFLKIWNRAFTEGDKLDGFWLRIPWRHLGEFLALDLDAQWEFFALKYLVTNEEESLIPEIARQLRDAHPYLKRCLQALLQMAMDQGQDAQTPWETARRLYVLLATNGYPRKLDLLATWLALSLDQEDLQDILLAAPLSLQEQQYILESFASTYIPRYPRFPLFLQWFKKEVAYGYSYEQQVNLLAVWLDSHLDEVTLKEVLSAIRMSTEEWVRLFETSGQKFIQQYPNSATLISLFASVSHQAETFPKKMSLLQFWLSLGVLEETLERSLQRVRLDRSEMKRVLLRAGCDYLLKYPGSRVLHKQFGIFIASFEIELPPLGPAKREFGDAQLLERLYQSLHEPSFAASLTLLPEESQQALAKLRALTKAWWLVSSFFKQPALTKAGLTALSEGVFTIKQLPDYAKRIHQPLLLKLAQGLHDWQVDRSELAVAINMLEIVLEREEVFKMVDLLVEQVRQDSRSSDRERAERAASLITACVYLALNFTIISDEPQDYETFGVPLLRKLLDIAGDEIYERFDGWGRHHPNEKVRQTWTLYHDKYLARQREIQSTLPTQEQYSRSPEPQLGREAVAAAFSILPKNHQEQTATQTNQTGASARIQPGEPPSPAVEERLSPWFQRVMAHLLLRLALFNGNVEKVAEVYYRRQLTLDKGRLSETQQEKLDLALAFEHAYLPAKGLSTKEAEEAIISAFDKIGEFNRKHPFYGLNLSSSRTNRYQLATKRVDR